MQDAARTIRCGVKRPGECCSRWLGRCGVHLGLAAVLSTGVLGADVATQPAAAAPARSHEISVRLHSVAVVSGEQVVLGDVAEIRGDSTGLATSCPVVLSPKPGHSLSLSLDDVQKALSDRGANLSHWIFRGNTRCTVTRPTRRDGEQSSAAKHPAELSEPATTKSSAFAPADDQTQTGGLAAVDPNTLGGALYQQIQRRLADLGGAPVVQFPKAASRQMELSRPTYEFQITSRSEQLLGMLSFEVTVTDQRQEQQTLQIVARVSLRKPVAVAARSVNKGKVLESADVTMQEQVFDRVEEIGLASPAPIIGQQAKRFIEKGEQVAAKDFEPLPLVHRNDLVTVLITCGNLRVRGTARALDSGTFGELIEVRNEMGERSAGRFSAVVVGEKTVEVQDVNRPTATAPAGRSAR